MDVRRWERMAHAAYDRVGDKNQRPSSVCIEMARRTRGGAEWRQFL
jgi:hypothetical protein